MDWLPGISRMTFSEVERNYRLYFVIINDDSGQVGEVPANVVGDLDDSLTQEALWEEMWVILYG